MTDIYDGWNQIPARESSDRTICWGIFDGVHRGHQKLIRQTRSLAETQSNISSILLFKKHPKAALTGSSPPSIQHLDQRIAHVQSQEPDEVLLLPFTRELAGFSPERFYREILLEKLTVSGICAGHDTKFGKKRKGDFRTLQQLSEKDPVEVKQCPAVEYRNTPISSTRIRDAILNRNLNETEEMLGRSFQLSGTVVSGEQRGKEIGFPTANLDLHHDVHPPLGIYGGRAELPDQKQEKYAMVSIGRRPTYEGNEEVVVEAHLLDFEGDLYGETLHVDVLTFLRDEKAFDSEQELIDAIKQDIRDFRNYLS